MPKSSFADEQISFALQQPDYGTSVGEICREMGMSEATFYRWSKADQISIQRIDVPNNGLCRNGRRALSCHWSE